MKVAIIGDGGEGLEIAKILALTYALKTPLIFAQSEVPTFEKERGITINSNIEIKNFMRSEWLLKNEGVETLITSTDLEFEKPKSKYHK